MSDRVLIVDFGSQVTQLIARRVRENGVYSEIHPYNKVDAAFLAAFAPKAIILSGGPASVTETDTPRANSAIFEMKVPVLGICYGQQTMMAQLGGRVEGSDHREFGRAYVEVDGTCALFDGVWQQGDRQQVWMSHGDRVIELAPGFRPVAVTEGAPFAAVANDEKKLYGVQFHPEVVHTPHGAAAPAQLHPRRSPAARATGPWPPSAQQAIAEDPCPGRQGPGHLRAFRRGRFLGRRGAVAPRPSASSWSASSSIPACCG